MSKIYVVPTPIGNLSDMSKRSLETLEFCNFILAEDTRHTQKLLNFFEVKTKLISYHKFNEKTRSKEIVDKITEENLDVALVTDAGTPCISDPGYELIKIAREHSIEIIGLPGASAITVALSISGIPTEQFAFYGFLPRKKSELEDEILKVSKNKVKTFVIYESPKRIENLLKTLQNFMPNAQVCVCKELTKVYEKSFYGTLESVISSIEDDKDADRGEYVVVGYNNDYKDDESNNLDISLEAILFDKLISKKYSLKDAIKEVVSENTVSKNEVYKASLEIKKFLENYID